MKFKFFPNNSERNLFVLMIYSLSNCVYPELPQHGTYSLFFCIDQPVPGQKAKHECLLQFSCNEGFEISSNKLLICMDTGKWSAPVPTCEPSKAL